MRRTIGGLYQMTHGSIVLGAALLLACATVPATSQTTADTRAHVDTSVSTQTIYPAQSQDAGEQGSVVLSVNVARDGMPMHIRVAQSSGFADLDAAAIETALNWHYVPATHDGEPHPQEIDVRVVYQLPQAPAAAH
jgi:TonB family protein